MVVFFSSSTIAVFLLFAVGLAYQSFLTVQGIMVVISGVIFLAEIIACCAVLISKIKSHFSRYTVPTITDIIMTLISSILLLFVSYLFVCDIRSYGDGILDMICFFVGVFIVGALWFATLAGWIESVCDEGFCYSGFFHELIGAAIILFLVYGL